MSIPADERVVIRADGGPDIGYGHLVRTGALAEVMLERGHAVTCATTTPEVARSVHPDDVAVLPLEPGTERKRFPEWVASKEVDVVLTDSYEIETAYQHSLREAAPQLGLVLDDTRHIVNADMLVNGNVYARNLDYEYVGAEPDWCLGLNYLLIREPIRLQAQQEPPWRDSPERALVTMGGSDTQGATPRLIPAFEGTDLSVDVIIGPGFDDEIESKIHRKLNKAALDARLLHDPPNLVERMFEADIAVSATGSTSYELLALGTPTIGIPQADNQILIAEGLVERDAIIHLSSDSIADLPDSLDELIQDDSLRKSLRQNGRALVEADGVKRVADRLEERT